MKDLNKLAKEIVLNNQYLTLNTINGGGKPWSCILAYTFDSNFNFYFVSLPSSGHSKHIEKSEDVAFTIFDSTQGFSIGVGLQIEAKAKRLHEEKIPEITKTYFERKYPYGDISNDFTVGLKKFLNEGIYIFYQLTPTRIWINDPNANTDKRVEISLKETRT
ncbi:MAG: Pyridoxamine 5'-phosphate oxidase-related FMN-binding protein [Candidatus Woesebacteria bacterium GW2011_GWA1_39_21]|uniref:Pyridoxamine 5'-phosphate oxidase-related FMN-binding protein n=1 Tax=Candidatus Woesebacteria bacterium GW2011_GWA1_39_21 TaxID=1618550 RepID=A0A0G0N7X1_9BACT|nr:MAG: Pyridoxamine 5'-phosphate oxidase-related FMN-binding protein [Candidatus Woesebacteria bacterium GW2011_GWA1_39_21]